MPAVSSGQVDIGMSAITVNEERSAQVDFIEYLSAGSGVLLKQDSQLQVVRPEQLCGHTVGVQAGTVQESSLQAVVCTSH